MGTMCIFTQAKPRITQSAWSLTAWPRRFLRFFFGWCFQREEMFFQGFSQLRRQEVLFFCFFCQIYVCFLNTLYVYIFFVYIRGLLFFNVIYICCNYFHVTLFGDFGRLWFNIVLILSFHGYSISSCVADAARCPGSRVGGRSCWWEVGNRSLGVSENRGTPKSSILIGFSIINHPFWGTFIFGNTHIDVKGNHPSLWYISECWTLLSVLQVFAAEFM